MAGALEHEDPGVTLPGKPSGGWRAFAGRVLRGYGKREKDRWP